MQNKPNPSEGQNEIQVEVTDKALRDALHKATTGLRYGSVEVVVHDGRIVQVVRTERIRVNDSVPR